MKQITRGLLTVASVLVLSASLAFAADPVKDQAKAKAADTKASAKQDVKATAAKGGETKKELKADTAKLVQIDINTATDAELKSVPGIGDAYAAKIIAGRPYAKKDQLKSRNILPSPVYEQVKDRLIAKQAPKK